MDLRLRRNEHRLIAPKWIFDLDLDLHARRQPILVIRMLRIPFIDPTIVADRQFGFRIDLIR